MKKIGIFCLLCILALSACRKNIDEVVVDENPFTPPVLEQWEQLNIPVPGSVIGFVTDESGTPVSGASISMGTLQTSTDEYGHFFFNNVTLNARGTYVKVEKPGYFAGSRRFFAVSGQKNRVRIELLSKNEVGNFASDQGGTVSANGGATIEFSPNSIRKTDGSLYNGTVHVAATWLDPSNPRTMERMPGNLQGVDQLTEEVVLSTFGMMAVELTSETGDLLNILEGSTAVLSMPIPASMQSVAPAEIPLWSFNEEYGIWVEESKAVLQDGAYVGEVSHFSFWNCDFPGPLVNFTVVLEDENGVPLNNYKVVISLNNSSGGWGASGSGISCPNGQLSGLIPKGEILEMKIYDFCDEIVYTATIGPFNEDVDLGTLVIPASTLNTTILTGELVDCDGTTIPNGLVIISIDAQILYEYVAGTPFEITFGTCANTVDVVVTGVDLDNQLQSEPVVAGPNGTFDLGDISVCDIQLSNYIIMTVDGTTAIYTPAFAYPDSTSTGLDATAISFFNQQSGQYIYFTFDGFSAGNYDNANSIISLSDQTNGWSFSSNVVQGVSFDSFTITEYGNTGEEIKGTFSGNLENLAAQPPVMVSVSGEFSVIRDF